MVETPDFFHTAIFSDNTLGNHRNHSRVGSMLSCILIHTYLWKQCLLIYFILYFLVILRKLSKTQLNVSNCINYVVFIDIQICFNINLLKNIFMRCSFYYFSQCKRNSQKVKEISFTFSQKELIFIQNSYTKLIITIFQQNVYSCIN